MTPEEIQAFEKIKLTLNHFSEKPDMECAYHPLSPALTVCSKCSAPLCWECISEIQNPAGFLCCECEQKEKATSFLKSLAVMRLPVFWVILCISIAALCYVLGFANPDINSIITKDAGKEWYKQQGAKLYLAKASREQQRSVALEAHQRDNEAKLWRKKAILSFSETAELWRDTPVFPIIKTAQASLLHSSGENKAALNILSSLKLNNKDAGYTLYHYIYGVVEESRGNTTEAKTHFKNVLNQSSVVQFGSFDPLIDGLAKNRREFEMIHKVLTICQGTITQQQIIEKCRDIIPEKPKNDFNSPIIKNRNNDKNKKDEEIEIEFLNK